MRKIVTILVCLLFVFSVLGASATVYAGKPSKPPSKPPKEEPPADPAIAVVSPTGRGYNGLHVMNDDGSNIAEVHHGYHLDYPSWSPDGASIAFSASYDELWRIDVDVPDGEPVGSNPTFLLDRMQEGPEWSPGGQYDGHILFNRYPGSGYSHSLEIIPATGGDPQVLYTDPDGTVWNPVWSPDGNRIAFVRSVDGVYSLGIYDVVTGGTSFWDLPAWPMRLDWARQRIDDEIAYSIRYKVRNKYVHELYTIDSDSGQITPLFRGSNPTWSPEDKLCYESNGLRVYDSITGESEQINKWGYYPDWCRATSS
jgi:Tol biopolymer transport system component